MADQDVLGFLNQPISEKKAPPEDPVLSFLNRPIPGAEPPASAPAAPAPPAGPPPEPPITLSQISQAISEAGRTSYEAFNPPPSPESVAPAPALSLEPAPVPPPAEPGVVPPPVALAPVPPPAEPGVVPPPAEPDVPGAPSLADMAAGEGAGGGGGGGWGADRKVAAEPLVPERTGVLGVIDKGTELAAKGLAEAAAPAAEYVGAAHGFLPELSAEDKEKSKTDVGNALLNFGRGWIQGRTFGLYVPPELTEDQKRIGGEWAQTIGSFAGMSGAIHSIASKVTTGLASLGIKEVAPALTKEFTKYSGGVGAVTGFIYSLFDYAGRNLGVTIAGTETEPGFSTGMIASGLEYGAAQLGQPEVAEAIHKGAKALGPTAMAMDFMAFALGGVAAARLLSSTIGRVEAVRTEARAQKMATSEFNWKTDNVDEAISVLQQSQDRTARTVGKGSIPPEEANAIEAARTRAIKSNPTFTKAALYMRMGDEFRDAEGNLLPIDQVEAKLAQGQARVDAEKQAASARQAAGTKEPAAAKETPAAPAGQPVFASEGEGDIAPTSTKVLTDLRDKAVANPGDAWVMRGKATDMHRDPEALQLMQKNLVEIRQDEQGNVWMRAAGEYPEVPSQATTAVPLIPPEIPGPVTPTPADIATTKPQTPDAPMGNTGSMVTDEGSVKPEAAPLTQGGERQVGLTQSPTLAEAAATPTQPMGSTGTTTTEAGAPKSAEPAALVDWQSNPSVQHFQAQGFEFVQAKNPEEIADLQTQGFEKSGVAPDLWFKRPAPVEPPVLTPGPDEIAPSPASGEAVPESQATPTPLPSAFTGVPPEQTPAAATEYWPAKAEPRIKPIGPGRIEVSYYDGTEVQHHIVATIEEATALKDKVWTPAQAAVVPEVPKSAGERWGYGPAIEAKAKELGVEIPERTKPAPGDEVYKYATGFGGSDVVIRGTVTQNKMKELRVKLIDMSGMFGTTSLEKKKTKGLTIGWTKKGEPAHRDLSFAIREAEAKADKAQKQAEQDALAAKIHESKMAGNKHLDDLTPQPGMKIRDIETGKTGVIDSVKDYGIFATGIFDGATNPRSLGNQIGRYVVVPPKPLPSAITGKKTGPVVGANPVAPRGAGLHPGITGKPKAAAPAPAAKATTWLDRLAGLHPDSTLRGEKLSAKELALREKAMNAGLIGVDITSSPQQWKRLGDLATWLKENAGVQETFKAGDRVSFRNAGKDLSGTLDNAPDKDGLVDINVDVAGVKGRPPIGQLLMGFKVENLTMLEAAPTAPESKETDKNKAVSVEKPKTEPIISDKGTTQAPPEGGKGNENAANIPGKASENDQGSTPRKGSKNLPPVADGGKGKVGAVSEGSGRSDDGVVQPGGGGRPSSESGTDGGPGDAGREHGPEPVHGGSPGDLAGVQRPPDYRITPGELKRPGGWKATAAQNLDIIELAKKLEAEGRWATPEEQALLVQYTGFGAGEIRNNIFPRQAYSHKTGKIDLWRLKEEWRPLAEKLMAITTPEELAEIAQSTQYAHYTSEAIIRSIYQAVERMGFPGGKILEPGMGNGLFGMLIPDSMRGVSKYTGIERDSVTALIAKHLLPNQNVMQADFIKQKLPDNFFDLGIGNPPFADTVIEADPRYAKLRFTLHDFFFAKTIDKIHPGGLQVFITSRYTMDKGKDKARQYLADRADLIGAIRLPQTAFKANAGTEVVTDVLFLRKRAEGEAPGGVPWMEQGEVPLTWEEKQRVWDPVTGTVEKTVTQTKNVLINEYFVAHPEMVLGNNSLEGSMYGENEYTVKPHEGNIEDHFAKAVKNLPKNVYSIVKRTPVEQERIVVERDFNPLVTKEGNVYIDVKGNLMVVEQGSGVSIDDVLALRTLSKTDKVWVRDYVPLRDALKQASYDQHLDGDWEKSFKALVKTYDAFVKKHGQILAYSTYELAVKEDGVPVVDDEGEPVTREYRRFKNARRLRADVESPLVYALEKITDDGEIVKHVALLGRFVTPPKRIEPKTSFEALAVTLDEVGKLDLDLIASKLNISRAEAIEALGDMIYKDPAGTWQTSDEYLSGDVVTKLEEAQAAAKSDTQYQRNVEALELAQPVPLTPAQVAVNLGSSWVSPDYISQFAQEILGVGAPISYNPQVNIWRVDITGRSARQQTSEWGTSDRSAGEILDSVLNNKNLVIKRTETDAFGVKHTFTDTPATTRVNEIAKNMREAFATWAWSDVRRADDLLSTYNRKYNNLAGRKFDGSHLTLPGLSINFPLHAHQKRAIWRAVVAGNTYLNHAVGAGKTLEMICAGMEMKRLGLIAKPLYVVPNHMLDQFTSDFMSAYPMANIMVADEKNFHTDNRKRFMAQAALNNPDAIIITHSSFGKLSMKPENVAAVRDSFIRDLEDLLHSLNDDPRANRILIAKVENRIEKLQQRFDGMSNAATDQALTFEELGADHLFLDEAHEFRKLDFITNRQAKGIDSNGSRMALDLYVKTMWLESQRPGRSHVFATGTPIVNTMGELYTIMRFFDDGQMEADGIHYFDAWANMFGQMVSDWEKTGAGNWEEVSRFASFVNVPELMKRVRAFTDVLTPSQLGGYVDLPKVKGGKATLMLAPDSPAMKNYQTDVLQPRLVNSRAWRPSPGQPGNPDPVINIITDGRLASIDMRFIYPDSPSDPTSKLNLMIDEIIVQHNRTAEYPYIDKITGQAEPIKGAGQIVFYNHGFGKMVAINRGFDARAWAMKKFKEAGIPSSQVAWIDDYPNSMAKGKLCNEVRQGVKRILIGSCRKMGTGLNVQNRMLAGHILDPPWFPASLEQAEGRYLRQGNQNLEIIMMRWATKGSYDATMWQMVARKAKIIEQAWAGDESVRTLEDVSPVSQYQMAAAISSGDERVIELARAHGEATRLHRLRDAHHAEQRELRAKESSLSFWIPKDQEEIGKYKAAEEAVGGYVREVSGKIGKQAFTPDDKRGDVGMALMQSINDQIAFREKDIPKAKTEEDQRLNRLRIEPVTKTIGNVNGFDLTVTTANHGDEVWATLNINVADMKPWIHNGKPFDPIDTHGGAGLVTRIVNVLNNFGRDVSTMKYKLDEKKADLKRVEKRLGMPFPEEAELIAKEGEVSQLQAELAATGTEAPSPDVGVDIAAGLAAEKTATYRTGPTIATAMRRPLVAGARYRLGGIAGMESKTGHGTRGLPAAFTGKKETFNAPRVGEGSPITLQTVQEIFGPEIKVAEVEGGEGFHLTLPNGKLVAIFTGKDLTANAGEVMRTYGREMKTGEWVAGEWRLMSVGGVVALAKGAGVRTLHHETFHAACDLVLTQKELDLILKKHGDWESAAGAYEKWEPKGDPQKDSFFQRIWNFFKKLAQLLRPTARGVFEKIRSGKVWLRSEEGPGTGESGMFKKGPLGERYSLKKTEPITPKENKAIDKWLGKREITDFDAKVLAGNRQRAIMAALGKKKFDAECKAIDNAMTHYIELKSFPDHVDHYYADLKPEDQKAVDLAQHTIPKNPKLKAIADKIAEGYEVQGDLALDAEVVHELRENYAAHIWNLDKGPSVEAQRKFATKTGHAQQRTFDTEIQGLAAGYEPLVRGATNKAMIYSQDVGHTIADRQFIKGEMGKTLSTKQSDERPTQIQHPNMRGWKWAGSIEVEPIIAAVQRMSEEIKNSTKTSSTTTGPGGFGASESGPIKAMKEVVRTSLVIRGMTEDEANAYINRIETAAVKASTGEKATPGQAPPEKTTTVIQELRETIVKIEKSQEVVGHTVKPVGRKDLFVNAKGDIFQKVPLFASEGAAKKLNNILGTSALKNIRPLNTAINISNKLKELILFLSGYHHQAGMRGWLLGVTGQFKQHGLKALSPRQTYRQGLDLINEMDPVIRHGVQTGGLVLGMSPEWRESLNHDKGKIGVLLDKWKVTKTIRGKVFALWDQQVNFLFGKLFPGLQSMAYVTELKNFMKKFPGTAPDEAAKKVAELCNYNFGNLNYPRLGGVLLGGKQGRNPTVQHLLRAVFLAPQWTESNYGPVRELVGALLKGDKETAYVYRKFWASVFAKGIALLLLGNLAMSMFDDKNAWESFKERWRAGNLKFLGLNMTPVYRGAYKALGMEPSKSQKVFSPMGHFLDVIKMGSHPLLFLHHKASPLSRVFHEAMGGVNWKGQAYTTAGELAGTTAGGALKGKIVKEGKGGPISISQMPSFLLGQLRGSVPIPIGNLMGMLLGEMDGFDALTKSSGTMITSFTPKTEAQGIISDYYQAALPNRNLTPEEQDRKKLEKELLKQARSGDMDGFTDALKDAVADGKLSTTAAKNLMKEAQHPEGVASFAKLPLEVALKAFEAASDQEKELWGPALIEKVARSQPETLMHNQASLQDVLRGLGMEDFADTLDELHVGAFTPGPLTSPDEYRGLSSLDMGAVDSYLAGKITGQAKKSMGPVKAAPRMTHPSKTGPTQKEKLRRLGLG